MLPVHVDKLTLCAQRGQEFAKVLVCHVIAFRAVGDEHDDSDRTQQSAQRVIRGQCVDTDGNVEGGMASSAW